MHHIGLAWRLRWLVWRRRMSLQRRVWLWLLPLAQAAAPPVSVHDGRCIDGGDATTIRIHFPPSSGKRNFTWPPLAPAGSADYEFALERAIVIVSPGCSLQHGLPPNADNGPGTPRNLWLGRVHTMPVRLNVSSCGCGAAIFACGSGGCTGDNLRLMRELAAHGLTVISPDSMASPGPASYPRRRPIVSDLTHNSYWCASEVYSGGCTGSAEGGAYPACFSSDASAILYDPAGWAALYERVYTMRARELDYVSIHMLTYAYACVHTHMHAACIACEHAESVRGLCARLCWSSTMPYGLALHALRPPHPLLPSTPSPALSRPPHPLPPSTSSPALSRPPPPSPALLRPPDH